MEVTCTLSIINTPSRLPHNRIFVKSYTLTFSITQGKPTEPISVKHNMPTLVMLKSET